MSVDNAKPADLSVPGGVRGAIRNIWPSRPAGAADQALAPRVNGLDATVDQQSVPASKGPPPLGTLPGARDIAPLPSYLYRAPPGLGNGPQYVYATHWLAMGSFVGPYDLPLTYRRSLQTPPVVMDYFATLFGQPISGGSPLVRALSNYNPIVSPFGSSNY